MRVAFLSIFDSRDVTVWSGTPLHMAKSIEGADSSVTFVGPLADAYRVRRAVKTRAYRAVGRRYHHDRDPKVLRAYAVDATDRLSRLDPDVVLSPGALPFACLDVDVPLVTWGDATFAGLVDYYPAFRDLASETLRGGYATERAAVARASLLIFSSRWAARSAQDAYDVPDEKIAVVSYGANLTGPESSEEVRERIAARPREECRLVFLASDWKRKGGKTALEIAERCNRMGIPTRLVIFGRGTPSGSLPHWVDYRGFVDKAAPEGVSALASALGDAHFLLLPSEADCTPIAIAEASAFGVPSLATRTGGIPEMINSGKNGFVFDLGDVDAYCDAIARFHHDVPAYNRLALASFDEYRTRLNWQVSGAAVRELLRAVLDSR